MPALVPMTPIRTKKFGALSNMKPTQSQRPAKRCRYREVNGTLYAVRGQLLTPIPENHPEHTKARQALGI